MVNDTKIAPNIFGTLYDVKENQEILPNQYAILDSNILKFHTLQDKYGILLSEKDY